MSSGVNKKEILRRSTLTKPLSYPRWVGIGFSLMGMAAPTLNAMPVLAQQPVTPIPALPSQTTCNATKLPLAPNPVDLGGAPKSPGSVDLGPFKQYEAPSTTLDVPKTKEEVTLTEPQPITLDQAIALSQFRDRDLQVAALQVEQQRAALKQTRSAIYPSVDAQAGITRSDSAQSKIAQRQQQSALKDQIAQVQSQVDQLNQVANPTIQEQGQLAFLQQQLSALNSQANALEDRSTASNTFSATLSLNYDVFTSGQRPASIRAAEAALRSSERAYQTQFQQLSLDVANDYYDLLQADDLVRIARQSVTNAEENSRVTKAKESAGIGTRFDVLQADVSLADNKQQLVQAESQQQIARRQLAKRLSLPNTLTVTAADPVAMSGEWSFSLEDSIVKALQNRTELAQILEQRKIAQQNRKVALGSLGPQLGFNASMSFTQDLTVLQLGPYGYGLGAQVSKTVFDGGSAKAIAAQQQANTSIAETQFSSFKNLIRFQIEQNYYTLESSKKRILSTQCAVEEANQALNLAKLRRDYGVGTSLEVSNATTSLSQAEGNYLDAIVAYNRALAALQRYAGAQNVANVSQSGVSSSNISNSVASSESNNGLASIATLNRAQQSYRLENNIFATKVQQLDAKLDDTDYTYNILKADAKHFVAKALAKNSQLKSYASGGVQENDTFTQILCESNKPSKSIASPYLKRNNWNCGSGSRVVK